MFLKYKNYILPLVFLKSLSDVFDDELMQLSLYYITRLTENDKK
jgi:type I restriction-modification system DNA methylase subunit